MMTFIKRGTIFQTVSSVTQSFSWQSTAHVCPTYQTTVTPSLLNASAEAEKEKRKMDRLAASTHFA